MASLTKQTQTLATPVRSFSIVTINYNNCEGLARTAKSILEQNFLTFDWIVVDGASTDRSLDVLKQVEFDKLTIISGKDSGIYNAMNKGLDLVNTDYVLFLNSGDTLASQNIAAEVNQIIQSTKSNILYGDITIQILPTVQRHWISGQFNFGKVLLGWHPPHPATIYETHSLKTINGYEEKYSIAADYDAFIRLYKGDYKFQYVNTHIAIMEKPGTSGGSLLQILKNNREVATSWKNAFYIYPIWIFFTKPLSKALQLTLRNPAANTLVKKR
jgi:glycosyltransferase